MNINKNIRKFRINHNISEEDFAKSLEISRVELYDIENESKKVSEEILKKFEEVYGIDLIAIEEKKTSSKMDWERKLDFIDIMLLIALSFSFIFTMVLMHIGLSPKGFNNSQSTLQIVLYVFCFIFAIGAEITALFFLFYRRYKKK